MFTKKALEHLIKENLPASELPRFQEKFRQENWTRLLTAKQIVDKFSSDEISAAQQLLNSEKTVSAKEYEPDAFFSEIHENGKVIYTEIEVCKGRIEDIYCSCELGREGIVCPHIRMLVYYIANGNYSK